MRLPSANTNNAVRYPFLYKDAMDVKHTTLFLKCNGKYVLYCIISCKNQQEKGKGQNEDLCTKF